MSLSFKNENGIGHQGEPEPFTLLNSRKIPAFPPLGDLIVFTSPRPLSGYLCVFVTITIAIAIYLAAVAARACWLKSSILRALLQGCPAWSLCLRSTAPVPPRPRANLPLLARNWPDNVSDSQARWQLHSVLFGWLLNLAWSRCLLEHNECVLNPCCLISECLCSDFWEQVCSATSSWELNFGS